MQFPRTHKATPKFKILQQQVKKALNNAPQPGPFTYIVQCMYIIPLLGHSHAEGFSHMLISSLRHFKSVESVQKDFIDAKLLAARLVLDILASVVPHEERILVKLLETFDIELKDMAHALCGSELGDEDLAKTREHLKQHVQYFMKSESYVTAVALITRFSIQCCDESFLVKLIGSNQFKAAEEWAAFMGKEMIILIIQKYLDIKMLKSANELVKRYDLTEEFPHVNYLYKESSLKKLAEKGCWDIAEVRATKETKLMEYLVYLAMEAGYMEKVDELCQRYLLEGYVNSLVPEEVICRSDYLDLKKLILEEIVWVDEVNELLNATSYIEACKIIGVDCEWKPNFEKGSRPNKVSIIQIASDKKAFIFDLIKLYEDDPKTLDCCFRRIMCSSNAITCNVICINCHNPMENWNVSGHMKCCLISRSCSKRLLVVSLGCQRYSYNSAHMSQSTDIQLILTISKFSIELMTSSVPLYTPKYRQKILGAGLNKTRRNSNWEQRPLSQNQKEYAALDAAVLVHIFHHVRGQPQFGVTEGRQVEWKSHIVSRANSARSPLRF